MRRVSTLGACEAVTAVRMEGWLKKRVFEDWTKRTEVAIIDGEMEQARREGMTRVAEAIQVGPVVMEEEEEEEDGGLDMGSLSIGIGDVEGGLLDDWDMAGRIKQVSSSAVVSQRRPDESSRNNWTENDSGNRERSSPSSSPSSRHRSRIYGQLHRSHLGSTPLSCRRNRAPRDSPLG